PGRAGAKVQHEVPRRAERRSVLPEDLTRDPLVAISEHRGAKLSSDGQAEPGTADPVWQSEDRKRGACQTYAIPVDALELGGSEHAVGRPEALAVALGLRR